MNRRNRRILTDGIEKLKIDISGSGVDKLVRYCDEISLWNRKMNLVGGTERDLVIRHVLDSLSTVPVLEGILTDLGADCTIADVGSGAGLPGVPLAIAFENTAVTLIERSARRASFLTTVRLILELKNVSVVELDVAGNTSRDGRYDIVVCRAFLPYERALPILTGLRSGRGVIAYCAAMPPEGGNDVGLDRDDFPLFVPYLDATRTLVVLRDGSAN